MGTTIDAWIEYDEYGAVPFGLPPEALPLNAWEGLHYAKDYRAYAALTGMRRVAGQPLPLYPLRGLPPNASQIVTESTGGVSPTASWLHPSEVQRSLAHAGVGLEDLSLEFQVLLGLLEHFAAALGDHRVRLVFEIE